MFKANYCTQELIFCFVFFLSFGSFAQHGESAPPAGGQHGAGTVVQEKEFSGHQNEKWAEVQKSLLELKIKVDAQKVVVTDLLKSKKNNEGKISQDEIGLLKKEHERLQALTNDYNQMLVDFQFRFPEKGLESGRKYIRIENQTIEEMENAPTIQGRLKKLSKKIKKQYQEQTVPEEASPHQSQHKHQKVPVGSKITDDGKSNSSDVTEQIILVK